MSFVVRVMVRDGISFDNLGPAFRTTELVPGVDVPVPEISSDVEFQA